MKCSRLIFPTLKETPSDAAIESHRLMLRSGLIRKLASGLYSYLPLGLRVIQKMENIIKTEMDKAGAQEFRMPLLLPRELWDETGRYELMGDLMMKVADRGNKDFVLGPTHEEAFTSIIRDAIKSYKELPVIVYQIGKKFRDEIRPRFGVMRGREFIMKDAYSFDMDEEGLNASYQAMKQAYINLFKAAGLKTVRVGADSGAMGGSGSEEFMVPSHIGENEIIVCEACGYAANDEAAVCGQNNHEKKDNEILPVKEVDTPDVRTIDELVGFFKTTADKFIKTIIYRHMTQDNEDIVAVLIRGDIDVNEIKLANHLGAVNIALVDDQTIKKVTGAPVGFAGPVDLGKCRIVADDSVKSMTNAITGANKKDKHLINVNIGRDFEVADFLDVRMVKKGDLCPECGKSLDSFRGIEVGHIFKLGLKYTKAMHCVVLDENGKEHYPIMGCYGIGVDRSVAAVVEQNHDENGILWPITIAPYHVELIPIKYDGRMKEVSDSLYTELWNKGVEVLMDDRPSRPGFKFKDADLLGIPIRITIGEKSLAENKIEIKLRATGETEFVEISEAVKRILSIKDDLESAILG